MGISLKENERLLYSLRELYRQYGYRSFRMSKFEKYELYAGNKDFLVSDRIITFTDTNGDLLALKPDVTLSIIRNATFASGRKQKLYYHENVYRPAGSAHQFHEIMQCGLECIGDLDSYDVYEVLHLAAESLAEISDKNVLSFSHLGILGSLLSRLPAEEQDQDQILHLVAARNEHDLTDLFSQRGWNAALLQDLKKLMHLHCSLKELPEKLRETASTWLEAPIMKELEELSELSTVGDTGIHFDISVINDIHYYNGIVFQGFIQGISEKVISGGRYDNLLYRMNRKGGAIGFAVYIGILEQFLRSTEAYDADVLLLYDQNTPLTQVRDTVLKIQQYGNSVSAQRSAPEGLFRRTMDLRGGGQDA